MITRYVVSSEKAAGKTAIAAGLGKRLQGDGQKVGFLKLRSAGSPAAAADDAAFMKQVLALPETITADAANNIKEDYARASSGKDIVIVEGILGASPDDILSQASYRIASALEARVIAIESYPLKSGAVDALKGFGGNLLGVVLNKVPKSQLKRATELRAQIGASGVNVLGVLPEDRALLSLTVGELAGHIQGKILHGANKSTELVESLMVGALSVDSGLLYFGRKANKAAIIRSDRPDMQLAALETPTTCLVVSGKAPIYYRVTEKAEAKGIPLVQTDNDTNTIVTRIEDALSKTRFAQEKKLPRLAEILQQSLDFKSLYGDLGLASGKGNR